MRVSSVAGAGSPAFAPGDSRRAARIAVTAITASIVLMVIAGAVGPAKPLPIFPAAPPSPTWFVQIHLAPAVAPIMPWIAVLLGATGLVAGLIAMRRGWRPSHKRLIAGSVIAVLALMVVPPVASGDPLQYYAAYGRVALLGHNPYEAGSDKWLPTGDPIATSIDQVIPRIVPLPASGYGRPRPRPRRPRSPSAGILPPASFSGSRCGTPSRTWPWSWCWTGSCAAIPPGGHACTCCGR